MGKALPLCADIVALTAVLSMVMMESSRNLVADAEFFEDPSSVRPRVRGSAGGFRPYMHRDSAGDYMCRGRATDPELDHTFIIPIGYGEYFVLLENETHMYDYVRSFEAVSDLAINLKLADPDDPSSQIELRLEENDTFVGGCYDTMGTWQSQNASNGGAP